MIASCSGLDEQLSDIDILRVWLNVKLGLDARSRFFVVFDSDTDEYQKMKTLGISVLRSMTLRACWSI